MIKKNWKKTLLLMNLIAFGSIVPAVVTPIITSQLITKTVSDKFQKQLQDASTTVASKTLNTYSFPDLISINKNALGAQNIQNLYNVGNASYLYAQQSKNETTIKIDALVKITNNGGEASWVLTDKTILSVINEFRKTYASSGNGSESNEASTISFNQVVYSVASKSLFLNVYAKKATTGNTVILKIDDTTGTPTVYFDALKVKSSLVSNNGVMYGDKEFNQFVIQIDGTSPTLLLIQSTIENDNKTIGGFLVGASGLSSNGVFSINLENSDANYLTAGKKIYVTSTRWINNGLIAILQRSDDKTSAAYSFSLNGGPFQTPFRTSIESLSGTGTAKLQTFYQWINQPDGIYLLANKPSDSPSKNSSDSGTFLAYKMNLIVDGNNASLTATKFLTEPSNLEKTTINAFSSVSDSYGLNSQTKYVAISKANRLIGLDASFKYVSTIALVSEIPTSAFVDYIATIDSKFYLYLSTGLILVYSSSGFVGYANNLASSFEISSPISFINQNQVVDGANYFSSNFTNFQSNFRANPAAFFNTNQIYQTVKPEYEFSFQETDASNKTAFFSKQYTVSVYQKLRKLNATGNIDLTSTTVSQVFLGTQTYNIFTKVATIKVKSFKNLSSIIQASLPSQLANFYESRPSLALQDFLNVQNVNLEDLSKNQSNVQVQFTPNDTTGSLSVNLTIGYLWTTNNTGASSSNVRSTDATFTFTISNFPTGPGQETLNYTLNPRKSGAIGTNRLDPKFAKMKPSELQSSDISGNFIQLSPVLIASTPQYKIVPNDVKGTAVITATFNFSNSFYALPIDSKALSVSANSVTWETDPVFVANPILNDAVILRFNPIETISAKNKSIAIQTPSVLFNLLEQKKTVLEKLDLLINQWFFMELSDFVLSNVSNVSINQTDDLTGSFVLNLELIQPFPNTLQTTYTHQFSGFGIKNSTVADVYSVSFLNKEAYQSQFNPDVTNNIFRFLPSMITPVDIIQRSSGQLSSVNQNAGWLVNMSNTALASQYIIDLTPNDLSGELLVTILFPRFIEQNSTNEINVTNNKRFVQIISGFGKLGSATQQNTGIYSLNWRSTSDLQAPTNDTLSPPVSTSSGTAETTNPEPVQRIFEAIDPTKWTVAQYIKSLGTLTKIEQLKALTILSNTALDFYQQNLQFFQVSFFPDTIMMGENKTSDQGKLLVSITFENWNYQNGTQTFSQSFSGFQISNNDFSSWIKKYNPLNSANLSPSVLNDLHKNLPSKLTPNDLAKVFTFTNTPLNNATKVVYAVTDDSVGKIDLVFFVKPQTSAGGLAPAGISLNPMTSSPPAETPVVRSDTTTFRILKVKQAEDSTTAVQPGITIIPVEELKQLEKDGFQRLNQQISLNGFDKFQVLTGESDHSQVYLILSIIIPLIIFLGVAIVVGWLWRQPEVSYLKRRICRRLNDALKEDRKRGW